MRNDAVESLIADIQSELTHANFLPLSKSDGIELAFLQDVLQLTDTEIADEYRFVDVPVFDLFGTVRISVVGDVSSVGLLSYPIVVDDVAKVESFTNMLYNRLKNKTVGQGKFSKSDQDLFEKGEWSGKLWIDYASTSIITVKQTNRILMFSISTRS